MPKYIITRTEWTEVEADSEDEAYAEAIENYSAQEWDTSEIAVDKVTT